MKKILILLAVLIVGGCLVVIPSVGKDKDDTSKEEEKKVDIIEDTLSKMTLEEKVGQMFIARHPEENALNDINTYKLGGYIFFARDFENESKEGFISKTSDYQAASVIPMFMGVDEEGGSVVRISKYQQFRDSSFLSPQELFNNGGYESVVNDTKDKAVFLKNLGINLNFAPVADVSQDSSNWIYKRTIGKNANETAQYVASVVKTMKEEKLGSVLKHFPGYGGNSDTHKGLAVDSRRYDDFILGDFLPFKAGVNAGANMVLVSHNIVTSIDSEYPSSLSSKLHEILREELRFDGVVITDDLVMGAIKEYASDAGEVAVLAVLAGNDMLCSTEYKEQVPAVINAVNDGRIDINTINKSVKRILKLKQELGLLSA